MFLKNKQLHSNRLALGERLSHHKFTQQTGGEMISSCKVNVFVKQWEFSRGWSLNKQCHEEYRSYRRDLSVPVNIPLKIEYRDWGFYTSENLP